MIKSMIAGFVLVLALIGAGLMANQPKKQPDPQQCTEIEYVAAEQELNEAAIYFVDFTKKPTNLVVNKNSWKNLFDDLPGFIDVEGYTYIFSYSESKPTNGYELKFKKICKTPENVLDVYLELITPETQPGLAAISVPSTGIKILNDQIKNLTKVNFFSQAGQLIESIGLEYD